MVDSTSQISITKVGELRQDRVKLGSLNLQDGTAVDIGLIPSATQLSKNDKVSILRQTIQAQGQHIGMKFRRRM